LARSVSMHAEGRIYRGNQTCL